MNQHEMLATNRFYDVEFFRRSNQGLSITLGRNSPLQDVYDGSTHPSRGSTLSGQLDAKPSGSQRKRVPVACERCRKRKIKCSGDEGDGRGCINCKNAGWEGCQFLRVQSWNTHVNPGRQWQHRYHPYTSDRSTSNVPNSHPYNAQTLVPYAHWPSGLEIGEWSSSNQYPSWNRMHYNPACSVDEAESISPHARQPPSYMLPDPDNASSTNIAQPIGVSRNRSSVLWLDQMNSVSIPQQNSQILSSLYPLTPAESHKSFRGIDSSASQGVSMERTLPTPAMSRNLMSASSTGRCTPPLSALSHRSSNGWQSETASSGSRSSDRNNCNEAESFAKSRSFPSVVGSEASFPYYAAAQSPQVRTLVSELPTQPETVQRTVPSQASETRKPRCRASRDSLRSCSPSSTPLGYSYTSTMTNNRRLHATKATRSLANGTPYMWNPPSTSRSETLGDHGERDPDLQTLSDRNSAASINTSSIY